MFYKEKDPGRFEKMSISINYCVTNPSRGLSENYLSREGRLGSLQNKQAVYQILFIKNGTHFQILYFYINQFFFSNIEFYPRQMYRTLLVYHHSLSNPCVYVVKTSRQPYITGIIKLGEMSKFPPSNHTPFTDDTEQSKGIGNPVGDISRHFTKLTGPSAYTSHNNLICKQMVQMAFCDLSHMFHKQITKVLQA